MALAGAGGAKLADRTSGCCCACHAWSAAALQDGNSCILLHSCVDGASKGVLWLGCRGLKSARQVGLLLLLVLLLLPAKLLMLIVLLLLGEVIASASR